MTDIKDKINPYIWTAPEYNTGVLDMAWAHPELGRMMLNENPVPPSDAVVAAGPRALLDAVVGLERVELPLLRFVEKPRIHYPGVELVADVELSSEKDPYVADHEVAGEQVFPAVFILEAMAQAARALTGEEGRPSCERVRCQRAVIVPRSGSVTVRFAKETPSLKSSTPAEVVFSGCQYWVSPKCSESCRVVMVSRVLMTMRLFRFPRMPCRSSLP